MKKNKSFIKIKVEGGTGNQLFMYFAGLAVAIKNESQLIIDTSDVGRFGINRETYLNQLRLDAIFEHKESHNRFKVFGVRLTRAFLRRFHILKYLELKLLRTYRSPLLGYNGEIFALGTNLTLHGYYQSWRYFDYCNRSQTSKIELLNPSPKYMKLESEIQNVPTAVVHIRRGDYVGLNDSFGLLSEDYFINGLQNLLKQTKIERVWIFSDEIDLVKNNFMHPIWKQCFFVPIELNPIETIFLMSKCAAILISNSTFSYWGALLSFNQDRVFAPSEWFKNLDDPEDLIPSEWNLVKSQWL